MRIIAGSARGTRLSAPEGLTTRPVLDRVKESWFASLTGRIEGASSLDVYSGVGSIGLEALSRGASLCVFVERDRKCLELLREHLRKTRLEPSAEVMAEPAESALARLAASSRRFDLIFMDPPFALSAADGYLASDPVLARCAELLSPDGLLSLRIDSLPEDASVEPPAGLHLVKRRKWGRNEVLFFEHEGRNDD